MSQCNGKLRHINVLRPSSPDTVALGQAVEERFLTVLELYFRHNGKQLIPPTSLDPDMLRWRQMRIRHRCPCCQGKRVLIIKDRMCCDNCGFAGDYRNTEAELRSTQAIAQWTVDVNARLRGQPSPGLIQWKD